ncbi:MAG: ABC transporter permease [Anaerolineaceae bacterium]|nr:ABC transporter permease [Anaerolineaceae bacterium]
MVILRKTVSLILTLFLFSFAAFMAFQIIPGDSVTTMLGTEATPEQIAQMREELGYDKPLLTRYFNWISGFVKGDLGTSLGYRMPVADILKDKIPITAALSVLAFLLVVLISFPLGILYAKLLGSPLNSFLVALNQIVMSVPPFFIGIVFTFVFGISLRIFTPGNFISHADDPVGFWIYLFFPALAIALPRCAQTIKLLRASILTEMSKDYVRSGTSRGNTKNRLLYVHVLRNALIPVITFLAMTFSGIVAGSIIIEQIFVIPGIGRLLLLSISNRDYPMVLTIVMIIALVVILMNYIADILCQLVDPRTRLS